MPSVLYAPLAKTIITQRFGVNPAWYRAYGCKGHNGIDFRTKFLDTPLGRRYCRPMASGVVIGVGNQGKTGYGIFVRVQHDDGAQSAYGHFYKYFVKVGQRVERKSLLGGTILGLTDNTGRSTGSHFHGAYRPPNWKKIYNNGFLGYINFLPMLKI